MPMQYAKLAMSRLARLKLVAISSRAWYRKHRVAASME